MIQCLTLVLHSNDLIALRSFRSTDRQDIGVYRPIRIIHYY